MSGLPAEIFTVFRRNKLGATAALVVLAFIVVTMLASVLSRHDPVRGNLDNRLKPPCWMASGSIENPLGCDQLGRDILSRIIHGGRASLIIGVSIVALTALIGVGLGLLAGFYGRLLDGMLSRIVDVLLAFPFLVFALGVIGGLGPGMASLIIALSFKGWVEYYRVARGEVIGAKASDYVLAARSIGMSDLRIMVSEILPNIMPSSIVLATFGMATICLLYTSPSPRDRS